MLSDAVEPAVESAPRPAANQDVLVLSAAFFFIFMGAGAQQQFLVPYLNNYLHFSNGTVVIAIVYLTFLVFRVLSAYIVPRISDYAAIVIGAGTYVLFVAIVLLFRERWVVVLAALLWGAGAALFWVSSTVRVLDVTDQVGRYGKPSGMLYAATHAGFLVGVLVLGLVLDRRDYPGLFQTATIMTLGGWIIILFTSRDGVAREAPRFGEFVAIWRTRKAQVLAFYNALSSVGFGIMLGVFAEYTFAEFGPVVLKVAVFYSVSRVLASSYGGVLTDRFGTHLVLLLGFLISAFGLVVPVLSDTVLSLGIASFALGILAGAVPVAAMAIVGDSALAARRYLAMAALFVWRDFGVAVGLLGGELMKSVLGGANARVGFHAAFIAFAAVFLGCAALTPVLQRAAKERL
jgi:MFS family permease